MRTRLLTVADRFELRGRGVVVVPLITRHELPEPAPTAVTLERPDGTTSVAEVSFRIPFVDPPSTVGFCEPAYLCLLQRLDKAAVPIGSTTYVESG